MRWVPLTVLVFAILPEVAAAPVPKHLMKDEPFWPTAVGTKWVYDQKEFTISEEITKAEPIKNGVRLTVRVRIKGEFDDIYDIAPTGISRRKTGQFDLNFPMLRLPAKVGDSWTYALPIQKGLSCDGGTLTIGEAEDIKVPAGTFRATKVVSVVSEVDGKPIPKPRVYTYWFAKGVGLVKLDWDGGGRVLKAFIPGKK